MSTDEPGVDLDLSAFTALLDDRRSNITMAVALVLSLVVLVYTTLDLAKLNEEVRDIVEGDNNWEVSFELNSITFEETFVMTDGEQRTLCLLYTSPRPRD